MDHRKHNSQRHRKGWIAYCFSTFSFKPVAFVLLAILSTNLWSAQVTYQYDSLHRLTQVAYADGTTIDYTYDNAGNMLTRNVVVADTLPPQLTINTPLDGATLNSAEVTFTGSATDCGQGNSGIASVTVNGTDTTGGTATGCNSANWNLTLPLSIGTNNFTVTATDASPAANQVHHYLTLIYLPLIADIDSNGLPDIWEDANGVTDPNGHSDTDGISDGDEYRAGTNPNDPLSKPEGANGINYVLLRDHFDDGQYEDRWYLSALDPYTNYSLVEAGTEIEAGVQQPFSDCKALRFQHFATVDVVNMVYHATLEMDGNGMTVLGLMKNQSMDNRIEIALDNDQQPHLTLSSVDAGVLSEIPVSLPESYQGVPLDLRITKAGSDYQVYVNNIHEGSFTNNGLDNLSVRPFVEASSCSTDEDDLASRIDLIELLVDRDADGRADTHEDANADGVVNPGESDPLNPDSDGDGLLDGHDNCVLTHNISQTDSGGVNNSDPDGIGDACQCGDQNADGKVTNTDAVLIQRHILGLSSPFNADLCNVNGDGSCSNTDAVIIKRAVLGLPPGVVQKCVAAVSLP